MMILFRRILFCLLWLWLPVSWAAESGWLRSPDNDHASIRLRADTSANGETRGCCWMSNWKTAGKPTGARRGKGAWRPLSPEKATCLR